jgi:hypothetical protein
MGYLHTHVVQCSLGDPLNAYAKPLHHISTIIIMVI